MRGPNVFSGYWDRPDANVEAFVDGWFRTGDLGELDEAGYLVLSGRAKELIISGGFNVYPREIEDAMLEHPGIAEVAVTGTPDAEWGELVTAWIIGDQGLDVAAVRVVPGRPPGPVQAAEDRPPRRDACPATRWARCRSTSSAGDRAGADRAPTRRRPRGAEPAALRGD